MVEQNKRMTAADAVKAAENARQAGSAEFTETDADGFTLVGNKEALVENGFVILSTEYGTNAVTGRDQVTVTAVLDKGNVPIRFTDGSSGVYQQLADYKGEYPVRVRKGLKFSEYANPRGTGLARTYYLDFDL